MTFEMFKSLKSQIVVQTLTPYVLAVSIACLWLTGGSVQQLADDLGKLLALGFLAVGIGLLQDLIPKPFKEWLVFWRATNRLPGYRAFNEDRRFSSVISREEVVSIKERSALGSKYQDRVFYSLYDKYRDKGNVAHYSYRYLQWRELATTSLVSQIIATYYISSSRGLFSVEVAQFNLVNTLIVVGSIFAARVSANMLVDYVLLNEKLDE